MAIFYTDSGSFGDITVSGSAIVSGTLSFAENSGGLSGSLFGTSSWANSASVVEFTGITNKPELVSSSGQISITATTEYSTFSSSIATKNDTQDISINALNTATSSYAINFTIQSQLAGVISSSTQFNALSDTSASFATTASFVNTLATLTASNVQLNNLTDTTSTNKILVLDTTTNKIHTTASAGTSGQGGLTTAIITTPPIVISPTYVAITSGAQHLQDGTYTITGVINQSPFVNHRVSGIFSWYTGSVTETNTDEIFLHRVGRTSTDKSIFMRTRQVNADTTYLEIASDTTLASTTYTFNLVKLI